MTEKDAASILSYFRVKDDGEITQDSWYSTIKRDTEEALDMAIKALEPRWIPVSDKLPKTSGVYRVTRCYSNNIITNYLIDACYFDGSDTWYDDNRINHGRPYVDNVIAWQENPEPYKPQESEG